MVPITYTFLLLFMLFILYKAGQGLQKNGCKIRSKYGLYALLIYTLNEGLRFGRGIDYNYYWRSYEDLVAGKYVETNIGMLLFEKFLISLDFSWEMCVLVLSFMFILGTLYLMKCYKEILPLALPIFVFFSNTAVENMIRWYLGFSFILIGLSFQLREEQSLNRKFLFFSIIACFFHYAIIPIPLIFYFMRFFRKPILHPLVTIILFYAIAFGFKTTVMLQFADVVNTLSMMSDKFQHYSNNTYFWLTGGFDGVETTPFPALTEQLFLLVIVLLGYKTVKDQRKDYVYSYNLFVIGFLLYPVARQIELLERFDQPFLFFRGILLAIIIHSVYLNARVRIVPVLKIVVFLIVLNLGRSMFLHPFTQSPQRYLYVWDKKRQTPESMLDMWNETRIQNSKIATKRNKSMKNF